MNNTSIWLNNKDFSCQKLNQDMEVDVLIVGGGIAGLSTLFELKDSNLKTILVEKNLCGHGVTSRSTAKVTFLQNQIVNILKNSSQNASLYLASQIDAIKRIKEIIAKHHIDCDFKEVSSYLFTNKKENVGKIEEIYQFLNSNQISVEKTKLKELDNILALKVDHTYTFHPLKYICYLKNNMKNRIYENSKVDKIDKIDGFYFTTVNQHIIKSKFIVLATHYPYFLMPFFLPLKSHVETSFIGAKEVENNHEISAINIDKPCESIRYYQDKNKNYVIYLYQSLATCNVGNIKEKFDTLNHNKDFQYLWSNKDVITNDYLPYIGSVDQDGTFLVATGFNTWGMTNGCLSGMILADLILKKKNPYIELFSLNRSMNLNQVLRFPIDACCNIKAFLVSTKNNVNNRQVIYKKIDGEKVAIYKDEDGEHIVLNKCPHMKCGLVFNPVEKTWDCLCHGSRFTIDGDCIEGPSNFDIRFKY